MLRTWSASDAFGLTPRVPADPLGEDEYFYSISGSVTGLDLRT